MKTAALVLLLVGTLGCATLCGFDSPSLATQLLTGLGAAVLLGGFVAIGYAAIGGDAPVR
jgi:hypothetical protein